MRICVVTSASARPSAARRLGRPALIGDVAVGWAGVGGGGRALGGGSFSERDYYAVWHPACVTRVCARGARAWLSAFSPSM